MSPAEIKSVIVGFLKLLNKIPPESSYRAKLSLSKEEGNILQDNVDCIFSYRTNADIANCNRIHTNIEFSIVKSKNQQEINEIEYMYPLEFHYSGLSEEIVSMEIDNQTLNFVAVNSKIGNLKWSISDLEIR